MVRCYVWAVLVLLMMEMMLLFQPNNMISGCMDEERAALLLLKASITNVPTTGPVRTEDMFPSWNISKESNCCLWKLVACSNGTSGRVVKLELEAIWERWSNPNDNVIEEPKPKNPWYLNASLFLPFHELQFLDLKSNQLYGTLENEGFERLSALKNLEVLILVKNGLDNGILPSIFALTSLKTLYLSANSRIEGLTHFEGIKNLSQLEGLFLGNNFLKSWRLVDYLSELPMLKILYLGGSKLNESSISSAGIKKLNRLEELDLSYNEWTIWDSLGGAFPNLKRLDLSNNKGVIDAQTLESLGKLQKLETLYLNGNNFSRSLHNQPAGGLCSLKKLEALHLGSCYWEGTMPPCLGNLTSLRRLDLSDNIFPWNIATSPVVALTSLEILALSNTQFQTPISFSSFANHSKLKVFLLSNDGYTNDLIVETEHPTNWVPTFQLKYLVLENYRVNMPKEGFPTFLYHQTELKFLTLVKTNLVGEFPSWLLKNNTKLNTLVLQENNFTGTLQDLPATSNYLELYAPNNNIQGNIPTNISKLIPNLQVLMMRSNSLEGEIPSSLGDLQYLEVLDLSLNSLFGEIPENLANGFSLRLLNLTGNCLSGQLFPKVSNASSMVSLSLAGNHFTGDIPTSLLNMQSLKLLDIREDNITGALPNWIGDMKSLKLLLLSKNHLSGSIPKSICRLESLEALDISNNKITGLIPPCFSPPFLKYVNFKGNGLTGMLDQMSTAFTNSSQLRILEVGDNHLTGNIPQWIANRLPELRILVLKGNHFGGDIPNKLCHLQKVTLIDLSLNNLSGPIPSCLANLTFNVIASSTEQVAYTPYFFHQDILFPEAVSGISDEFNNIMRSYMYAHVEFVTKLRGNVYEGQSLNFASGVDLSCNKLSGNIPPAIGNLSLIHSLNLSRNQLTGRIPSALSNLKSVESLDLSYNNLVGPIPAELVELTSLEIFSVAHNNLSGKTPDLKAQLATFEENSYEGNPFLCGPPLKKNCSTSTTGPSYSTTRISDDDSSTHLVAFWASFAGAFVVGFIGIVVFLFINPYWEGIWFRMVRRWIFAVEYFLIDKFYKLKHLVCG